MKKRQAFVALALATLFPTLSWGQVTQSYEAEVVQGAYVPITDGQVVPLGVSGTDFDNVVYDKTNTPNDLTVNAEGYPIGFDFKYDNQLMNQFFIGSHGFLVLGRDQVKTTVPGNPSFFLSNQDNDVIGFCYRSTVAAIASTEISYKTVGEAPNRQLIVQFKDLQLLVDSWKGEQVRDTVSLQMRLSESGKIEMITSGFEPCAEAADAMNYNDGFRIGLRGQDKDVIAKSSAFDGSSFSTSTSTGYISWRGSSYPADGLTYTFTPPEDCAAPATQPTELQLTSTTLSVDGSFKAVDAADHYLVLIGRDASLTALPENGKTYAKGDSIGTARVVNFIDGTKLSAGDEATFTTGDILEGTQQYYIHVLGVNSACFFGPKYNLENPLTASVSTLPDAPSSLTVTAQDSTTITVNVKANAAGDDVFVGYTTLPAMNKYSQTVEGGRFGMPSGNYAAGDSIDGGGYAAYTGKAKDGIVLSGLKPGEIYHIGVWSRNSAGQYSSTSVQNDTHTACIVPWTASFANNAQYGAPAGWRFEGTWQMDRDGSLCGIIDNPNASKGADEWIETPPVYLTEGTNRLVLNLLMTEYVNYANGPYAMRDRDTIRIQVAEDGSDNYTTVQEYTKDNRLTFASTDSPVKLYVPFAEAAGKRARVRLFLHVYGEPKTALTGIRIEQKEACDYPVNVMAIDSTVVADEAAVTWTPQGEEDAWDVRYKKTADTEWSKAVTVREKKYTLTGLEGFTDYDVQVRARCSATSQSQWSETGTFRSGMSVPFDLAFTDLDALPSGWDIMEGALSENTQLTDGASWSFNKGWFGGANMSYTEVNETADDWLLTPVMNLGDGSVNYQGQLTLTRSYGSKETTGTVQVVVAEAGKPFTPAGVALTIKADELPDAYDSKTYAFPLRGLQGKVRLGVYVHSEDANMPSMTLDSLQVHYTCVNDIEAKVDTVTDDSAHISWTSGADQWFYYVAEAGQPRGQYLTTDKPELALTGLKHHTSYEIGLTKACEPGDTAKVKVIEITTTGSVCAEPEQVKVTADKWTARIEWTGEAGAYNVRYRKQNIEQPAAWITEQVRDTFAVITNLEANTTYEYAVQAQCSKSEKDTSAYTPVNTFTTLAETCLTPADVSVTPSYDKADLFFESEADRFEVAVRKASDEAWTTQVYASLGDNDNKHIITLTGLAAETDYKVRLRAICAEGDSSRWTAVTGFATTAVPECVTPTGLSVEDITATSATLTWTADESNLSWNIRYRESSASEWTEKAQLTERQYKLEDLKANTVYLWRVQAQCEADRQSKWATQNKFTTSQTTAIATAQTGRIQLFVKGHTLNVANPDGRLIRKITVYAADGRTLLSTEVNTTENVFIPLHTAGQVVVRVEAAGKTFTMHTVIR